MFGGVVSYDDVDEYDCGDDAVMYYSYLNPQAILEKYPVGGQRPPLEILQPAPAQTTQPLAQVCKYVGWRSVK